MSSASVQNPPQPAAGPALPVPSRPQTSLRPRPTLPPSLLAWSVTETPPPPLQRNNPAAAVTSQRTKEREAPPLPPSVKGSKKPRTTTQQTPPPPSSFSSVVVATVTTAAETERRLALDKKVAGCLLARSWTGTAAAWRRQGEGRTALRCLCPELPRGSRCALHQDDARGRSWMEQQNGGVPPVGGDGEVRVPTVRGAGGDDAEVFAEYARWRRNVWMPSRFYVQHVRAIDAGQEIALV
ncbi:unnamed protein product [Urochloa humidicola]